MEGKLLKSSCVPNDWTKTVIIPLYRSKSRNHCKDHKGMTLLSVFSKVCDRIVIHCVKRISVNPLQVKNKVGLERISSA